MDPAILKSAYDRLIYNGLSPRVAVGVLGQLVNESGGSLNTGAVNPNDPGGSYGIAQWNRERLAGLRNFKSDAPDELSRQLDYVAHELKTTHKGVYDRMNAARSAKDMTGAALGYEAPSGYTRAAPERSSGYSGRLGATTDIPGVLGLGGAPAAPTTQLASARAANIDQFRQMMEARFPGINFTSGYRDPAKNAAVGGAKGSQHMHNLAVDIGLKGKTPEEQEAVYRYAREIGAQGIGYYPTSQSAHFDLRTGAPAAWGPNYSKSSLGQTPGWYQKLAGEHLKGGAAPAQTAGGGGSFWEGGGGDSTGGIITAQGPPQPAPEQPLMALQGFSDQIKKQEEAKTPAPVQQQAPPAFAATPPPAATEGTQVQAADLMSSLLARKRAMYAGGAPQQPPGILNPWAA